MGIKVALAGNPNCGKTTMFNSMTGSSQYVGNWPGVTVEKKEGKLKGHKDVAIMDLPGIYSLSPYTLEEVISRNYLINDRPDAIINLVDATNLERNLYLTTQLAETGIPMVLALNMMDIVNKQGDTIDTKKLSEALGCPIIETSALKGTGVMEAAEKAIAAAGQKGGKALTGIFEKDVEDAIEKIASILQGKVSSELLRWYAVKAFERDEKILPDLKLSLEEKQTIEDLIAASEKKHDDDSESIITNARYEYIGRLIRQTLKKKNQTKLTTSDKIDRIVTNRFLALPIFAAIMFFVYYVSVTSVGTILTDWTNGELVETFFMGNASAFLESVNAAPWLQGLIVDGIIGGVGAVIGFVPQLLVLFFFLAILEDCGYMARIAFIMDRIFRKFGLSGKSFIPILIGTGCGVPGVMASRTIENEKDRKMTVMVTTFIPCGAKLPIIALISGSLFPESAWMGPSVYFMGILAIILSGIILKKTRLFAGDPAPFVMELPQYHMPGLKGVLIHMWDRGKAFIAKAGTIIFVACAIIWFTSSFNWTLQMVDAGDSILASIGHVIAPIFHPLGFGNWQATVATITGLVAKENVVATMGVLAGIAEATEEDPSLLSSIAAMFTPVTAYSFLAFNMLCAPCFAAIGAIKREMGNWKWTGIAVGYQCLLAYIVAFMVHYFGNIAFAIHENGLQGGLALAGQSGYFGVGFVISILLLIGILWLLFRSASTTKKEGFAQGAKVQG